LTVDLVVKGDLNTDKLRAHLDALDYFVQKHDDWDGENKWYLNISCPCDYDEAESCIKKYCEDLSTMPEDAKIEWDQARYREFSIGYNVGVEPRCFENHISQETIARAAALGAGIGISLYPDSQTDE
ncbi:MAG: hypothetical protein R3242_03810, partial [Akkermansiaceae bacterium]|nr:hypothetical protein [Akkermansiaceae bacterium]